MNRKLMMLAVVAAVGVGVADGYAQRGGGGRGGGRGGRGAGDAPAAPPIYDQTMIGKLWTEGMVRSQAAQLAQVLLDSIGPRLTGSPGMEAASRWVISRYQAWGIPARAERYGTWNAWRRGVTHLDLIAPRVRSLEAMMLAWSPGTGGRAVEGEVVVLPPATDSTGTAFTAWLPQVRGKFVLTSVPNLSCRSNAQWEEFGLPETIAQLQADQDALRLNYTARTRGAGNVQQRLKEAGALGVLSTNWSGYPGINKIFGSPTQQVPTIDITCEDYGLLFRLAQNNQKPRVRLLAESESLGERPVFNTIAEIKGSERPNEYIVLSAHFDSWDGSSGATDNGTGTITMMEAMRILKTVYPAPKRTIVVGHWSGEEQGLNGSRAFSEDHPEIVRGLHVLFNQDNGTGRVSTMSPAGIASAGPVIWGYLQQIPQQITRHIRFNGPGTPAGGGSDNASFACHGTASLGLSALGWDYSNTTWHTNRDTYDKVVIDDLKNNATLVAMLAYLASEDPQLMPRDKASNPLTGQPINWTTCTPARRQSPTAPAPPPA